MRIWGFAVDRESLHIGIKHLPVPVDSSFEPLTSEDVREMIAILNYYIRSDLALQIIGGDKHIALLEAKELAAGLNANLHEYRKHLDGLNTRQAKE